MSDSLISAKSRLFNRIKSFDADDEVTLSGFDGESIFMRQIGLNCVLNDLSLHAPGNP